MSRTRQEIVASRNRIQQAIKNLTLELRYLDIEEQALTSSVRLDDKFFRSHVVGLLAGLERGIGSAELRQKVAAKGFDVSEGSFRTFLSRQKDKGTLVLTETRGGISKWSLAPQLSYSKE